jgi:hypothetical protein
MIILSYEKKLLGAGIPSYRRRTSDYGHIFRIRADEKSPTFPFEQEWMAVFAQRIETYRHVHDVVAYRSAKGQPRYCEGNSTIEKETSLGRVKRLTLRCLDTEDCLREKSPSLIRPYLLVALAREIRNLAPNLVVFDDKMIKLMENTPAPMPLRRRGEAQIIALSPLPA